MCEPANQIFVLDCDCSHILHRSMKERCCRWEPTSGIVGPAADISFAYSGRENAFVTMHFSRVVGLPMQDLLLRFRDIVALRWELECPGFDPVPKELPKCTVAKWTTWTFPLLRIEESSWLRKYAPIYQLPKGPSLSHFLLISMNDLVQLIARSDATAEWIPGDGVIGPNESIEQTADPEAGVHSVITPLTRHRKGDPAHD